MHDASVDPTRKLQILAAENTERLARALAKGGVYVVGDLSPHGIEPGDDPSAPETLAEDGPDSTAKTI